MMTNIMLSISNDKKTIFLVISYVIILTVINSMIICEFQETKAQLRIEMDAFPYD